ncbi:MAG TPA: hypothetical protein VLV78_06060 [Thermoanaerobaculia bacterium]|nr:hypothetical protein [Thermoanaerobaculia bacterium]
MAEQPRTDIGKTGFGSANTGPGTTNASEVCPHCGQSMNHNRGLEEFLGRIGISDDMIKNLKTQMQNVDVEEYLNVARDYLKTATDKMKPAADRAQRFAKDNPGKIAAGVAVLAVGAGLLINSMRERD